MRINQYYVLTFLPGYRYLHIFYPGERTHFKKNVHFGVHFSKKGIIRYSVLEEHPGTVELVVFESGSHIIIGLPDIASYVCWG